MRERCFGKIFNYIILCLSLVSAKDAGTNLITKLEGVLKTNMSSVAFNWTSENAVDGNVGPDPEQCLCCSGTTYSTTSWWTVDLGKKYPIEKATIYSRETENKFRQLQGFQLFLRNSTEQANQLYYDDSTTTTIDTSVFDIFLSNVLARYLTIQKAGILTICETAVFEGDCMIGTFGEECSKQCHCADNRICDRFTGQCSTPVCKIGWIGTACDTKCEVDAFGENCGEKCYCAGNTTCTIDYGICPDNCRKGYFGTHCNKVCPDGAFGTNCNDKCFCDGNGTCSKDEGICPGTCLAGYMGVHCNIAEKEDKLNLLLVIGVPVGGGVLVIVAILSCIFFYRRRVQSRNEKSEFSQGSQGKSKPNNRIDKDHIEIKLDGITSTQSMDSNLDKNESAEDGSSNSTYSKESPVINPDSLGDDVQIHSQETGTTDLSKPGSTFEPEQLPDENRYTSVLKPDTIYQYYNIEIKRRMKTYGVEELELEDEHDYEPVGEQGGKEFDQKERKADERVTKHNVVLGKLWAETDEVTKRGVLKTKTITKEERYLLEKKFEIITSEASYLKSINVLIDVFMMSDMFRYKSPTRSKVNKQEHDLIFSNILEIRKTSESFLKDLETHWKKDIYLSDVCKIVADQTFECYVTYCSTQHVQSRTVQELRQNSRGFDVALTQLEGRLECQNMDMLSFILLPMQRITRLRLLTNDVYKKIAEKGNKDDVRKEANRAHKYVTKVNKRCNRAALTKQGEDGMKRAAELIEFSDKKIKKIQIEKMSRYLVREKEVIGLVFGKVGKAQLESLYLYIFSDLAVLTKKKERSDLAVLTKKKERSSRHVYTVLDYCKLLALKAENIVDIRDQKYKKKLPSDIPEGHEKFLLRLILLENHNKQSVEWILSCKDKTEKDNWMKIIAPVAGFEDDQKIYTDLDFPLVQCIEKYTAQDDEELSLDESDEVRVTKKDERLGMYYGERLKDLEEGFFPKNHTKEIEDEHVLQRNHLMRYLLKHDYGEDE